MPESISQIPQATPDFITDAAKKLTELFPELVTDGKVDFEKLRLLLGADIADTRERFGLNWPGKAQAIRISQTPTTATLLPDESNSINWDSTQNIFIEGDNLEVLKILQKHYFKQIKMIYIDPPYNTGNDFVYRDDYADSIGAYLEVTGQCDGKGSLSTNTDSSGRFHSNWLNMMYPRLKLARNLLSDDGVIFVSIGDQELANLQRLMSEIFGESNALPLFTRVTKKSSNNGTTFSPSADYIVSFAKDIKQVVPFSVPLDAEQVKSYNRVDSRGQYKEIGLFQAALKHGGSRYPIEVPDGTSVITPDGLPWRWSKDKFDEGLAADQIVFKKTKRSPLIDVDSGKPSQWNIYTKLHLADRQQAGLLPKNYSDNFQNNLGTRDLKKLDIPFDFPKPVALLKFLASIVNSKDALVLDLFSGSGTTAHALMELNSEDDGTRRCISVQLPEPTDIKSSARKAGYSTISEITRERIRRAGEKLRQDEAVQLNERGASLDVGFRAYKLADTNFKKWRGSSSLSEAQLLESLVDVADSADDQAKPEALLTEVLLKLGFSLTEKIETIVVAGLSVFSVADRRLMAYLDESTEPTLEQLRALVSENPERLVILEDAFHGNDELKTNLVQQCRTHNVDLWTA